MLLVLMSVGCTGKLVAVSDPVQSDQPLPADTINWLAPGKQSDVTPAIADFAAQLKSGHITRRQQLWSIIESLKGRFKYDLDMSVVANERSAHQVLESGVLGDCTDYALMTATLSRAMGIPARVVYGASAHWIDALQRGVAYIPSSHAFVEVYLENDWFLVNPAWSRIEGRASDYLEVLPGAYLPNTRMVDFWAIGILDVDDMKRFLYGVAALPPPGWRAALAHQPFPGNLCCLVNGAPPIF